MKTLSPNGPFCVQNVFLSKVAIIKTRSVTIAFFSFPPFFLLSATAVTYFANETLMNMDKGLVTGSVFIDLAKAFDTVDHDISLNKLEYYGVCDESLPWFKNYFTGRKQFVHIDPQSSEELAMTSGVP